MSNVYAEKPNVVTVEMSDDTGTAQRFVVGKTLDDVIALVDPMAAVAAGVVAPTKEKRHRRTKAEMVVSGNGDGKTWP